MEIKDVLTREIGEAVIKVKGTIVRMGKKTEGTGQYGPWTSQPITLKDETGEIGAMLGNQKMCLNVGDTITIECKKSEKHGWTGAKVDEYKGAKQIKVTESALIAVDFAKTPDGTQTPQTPVKPSVPAQKQAYTPPTDWNERRFIADSEKQILIIRQSSISNAVNYLLKKDDNYGVKEVLSVAGEFENWILRDRIQEDAGVKNDGSAIPFGED